MAARLPDSYEITGPSTRDGIDELSQRARDGGCPDEQPDDGALELAEKEHEGQCGLLSLHHVRPMLGQAGGGLSRRPALCRLRPLRP